MLGVTPCTTFDTRRTHLRHTTYDIRYTKCSPQSVNYYTYTNCVPCQSSTVAHNYIILCEYILTTLRGVSLLLSRYIRIYIFIYIYISTLLCLRDMYTNNIITACNNTFATYEIHLSLVKPIQLVPGWF